MDRIYWLISVPNKDAKDTQPYMLLDSRTAKDGLSKNAVLRIPDLKVGTLDSLMALVDELYKMDTFVETVVKKIMRLWSEELKERDNELTLEGGASVDLWLRNFEWKEEKYPVRSPLKTLTEQIQMYVAKIEEELRTKSSEYTTLVHSIAATDRKVTGNLMIKDLSDIVKDKMTDKSTFPDTEFLVTLLVVVSKFNDREWLNSYESLTQYVVPRSSVMVEEDSDYRLYSVVLFRKVVDNFKHEARAKRFTVRDFTFADPAAPITSITEEKQKMEQEKERLRNNLVRWCKTNFSEAFSAWIHLKAIRVFVESVLRYGLPPHFLAMLVQPVKKSETKVRKLLAQIFNISGDVGGEETEAGQDQFFPYVNVTLNLELKQA